MGVFCENTPADEKYRWQDVGRRGRQQKKKVTMTRSINSDK